eukprot:532720-Hanusia_phi.AAC.1
MGRTRVEEVMRGRILKNGGGRVVLMMRSLGMLARKDTKKGERERGREGRDCLLYTSDAADDM